MYYIKSTLKYKVKTKFDRMQEKMKIFIRHHELGESRLFFLA